MPSNSASPAARTISKATARRFMLAHHGLYPPRQRQGKAGILEYIQQVGCIQFDPINIVGRNPDLVLQSRVRDYRPTMLDELLYTDRKLLDGWDKAASLYPLEDWPNFWGHKNYLRTTPNTRRPPQTAVAEVLEAVRQRGPLSSLDFTETEKVDWYWGPTKIVRACLEHLFAEGYLGVDHRVNNRRAFDLIERLIPAELLDQPDPFKTEADYQDWHVLRRVGSMGLASPKSGEYWLGILGVKSRKRGTSLRRLVERGAVIALGIEEIPGTEFYIRSQDLPTLEKIQAGQQPEPGAAFIAALDNLTWNRNLIQELFDFEYRWEVYKPKSQRQYGYYVLPVLYGDRFVARFDPSFDKKKRILTINNWWWETGVQPDDRLLAAINAALGDFCAYLHTEEVTLGDPIKDEEFLSYLLKK